MLTTLNISSILSHLKSETQANHNRIEKVACMKRLFADNYSVEEYRACLGKMYGFYSVIEPIIFRHLGDDLRSGFQSRSKIEPLKQDLVLLGLNEQDIASLPRCNLPAYVNSGAQSLGVWYVLEGSTLGGQVISRHLKKHFGDVIMQPMNFHSGHGEQTRSFWKQFCEILEEYIDLEDGGQIQEITEAAKLTFDYFTEWLIQETP